MDSQVGRCACSIRPTDTPQNPLGTPMRRSRLGRYFPVIASIRSRKVSFTKSIEAW